MSAYRRPAIAPREFVDPAGHPIAYGSRWREESPPRLGEAAAILETAGDPWRAWPRR
ncbi:hypothetical protein ACOKGD_09360 [Microbacterium phosphatis]|uniref:hypothetical protein n=1 Tax=Microbacterium phosphatis TaxID=3140248 RepID=UPI00313FFE80